MLGLNKRDHMNNGNKVLIYGDPHGYFDTLFEAVERTLPQAVIILGDFGLKAPLEEVLAPILDKTECWFIHGNHDTDSDDYYRFLFESQLADRNLHGRVVNIAGLRVAGVGGVFRSKVWHPAFNEGQALWKSRQDYMSAQPKSMQKQAEKYSGLHRQHHSSIWPEDYHSLQAEQVDILITHEAPTSHEHGFKEIDDLAFVMGAKHLFHGHHHVSYQREINNGHQILLVDGVGEAQCKNLLGEALDFNSGLSAK